LIAGLVVSDPINHKKKKIGGRMMLAVNTAWLHLIITIIVIVLATVHTATAFTLSTNHCRQQTQQQLKHSADRHRRPQPPLYAAAIPVRNNNNHKIDDDRFANNAPIVLMGRQSAQGRELEVLGEFLHGVLSSNNNNNGSSSSSGGKVLNLLAEDADHHHDDDSSTTTSSSPTSTAESQQQPQQVWILDASYNENGLSPSSKDWKETAQKLYDNDDDPEQRPLMIYINVRRRKNDDKANPVDHNDEDEIDAFLVQHSDYELCISADNEDDDDDDDDEEDEDWEHLSWELLRLVGRARTPLPLVGQDIPTANTAALTMGMHTFFLSLTYPSITDDIPFDQFCRDVDALEYRVDLLHDRHDRFTVLHGMQQIRRHCRIHTVRTPALVIGQTNIILTDVMPIVYPVRTQHQAGSYPDDTDGIQRMGQLLSWGLRGGVEVLDIESAWDEMVESILSHIAQRSYRSQILGSHHVVPVDCSSDDGSSSSSPTIELEDAVRLFQQCELNGRAHGAKLVLSIDREEDDRLAYQAGLIASALAAKEGRPVIPTIALILGDVGQFSRVINLPFTPVTHESLPTKAAPGQLTANEIMTTRLLTKIFEPLTYCILGHNIAYSVSPQMHSAGFAACKLPHKYVRADVASIEEFVSSELWKSADFGGASVTIPHKQAILPYVDILSEAAAAIGSVNTIIAKDEFVSDDSSESSNKDDDDDDEDPGGFKRVVYGDNTDWLGIYNPLHRLLGSSINDDDDDNKALQYCLIVGAGGTARAAAYVAAVKLGLRPLYYNRTPAKAQELADRFGGTVVDSLEEEGSLANMLSVHGAQLRVVISTLPATSMFVLPEWLLTRTTAEKPIVFDVNYKPYYTELLKQAESFGCSVVRGSEMLWEQGVAQFELWTRRTAPYAVMKEVVLQNCLEETPVSQPNEKSFE
jgi:3-dehydroquinate dehydratase type I